MSTINESQTNVEQERPGPPLPGWLFTYVINPVMKLILRSPLHGLVSDYLLLLTFHGRKSGKQYTIPLGYARQGETILLFTNYSWWKNLRGGAPVQVRLKGKTLSGHAEAVKDPQAVARAVQESIEQHGLDYARRRFRLEVEEMPALEQIAAEVPHQVVIRVQLQPGLSSPAKI